MKTNAKILIYYLIYFPIWVGLGVICGRVAPTTGIPSVTYFLLVLFLLALLGSLLIGLGAIVSIDDHPIWSNSDKDIHEIVVLRATTTIPTLYCASFCSFSMILDGMFPDQIFITRGEGAGLTLTWVYFFADTIGNAIFLDFFQIFDVNLNRIYGIEPISNLGKSLVFLFRTGLTLIVFNCFVVGFRQRNKHRKPKAPTA